MEKKALRNSWAVLFFLTLSPLSTRILHCVEGVSPYHQQSFYIVTFAFSLWLWWPTREDHSPLPLLTSLHTGMDDRSMSAKTGDIGSVHAGRVGGALTFEDGWSLAKIFHIHSWIFSAHGGQGQFLQSACHSKVKGMWLVDEGSERDRHAWGFMVVRWEAGSCWWMTVWAWRLRTCPLKGDAIRYPHLCEADIHMPLMQKRPISIAELPVFWSLCQVVWASVLHVWMRNVDLLGYDHWEKTPLHKTTLWLLKNVESHCLVCQQSCLLNKVLIKQLSFTTETVCIIGQCGLGLFYG